MNLLDIIILLISAAIVFNGMRLGFVRQATRFVGFILGLVIAFRFSPNLAAFIQQLISPDGGTKSSSSSWLSFIPVDLVIYRIIAFALLFFLTIFIVRLFAGVLNKIFSLPILNMLNRVAGLLLSFVQALIIVVLIVNILPFIPGPKLQSLLEGSLIATWIIDQTPVFTKWLQNWLEPPKI